MADSDHPAAHASPPRRARDGVLAILLAALLLVLVSGGSIRGQGEEMRPGLQRDVVVAVGKPAGWLADRLPFDDAVHEATAFLSPDEDLGGGRGFAGRRDGVPPVRAGDFARPAPAPLPRPRRRLRTLLATGDSLVQPLDAELARRLAGDGVRTVRDSHVGTGLSKSELLDWGKLSRRQAQRDDPDAVVVFIGANDGFDMTTASGLTVICCGTPWAVEYAQRARAMMDTYRRGGAGAVYWLTVPMPRGRRAEVARVVNRALRVAATPYRHDVRLVDLSKTFTPGERYRDALRVGGRRRVVREPDGIHLNALGAEVAARIVLAALRRDLALGG
jgi:uncharacterized protein